MGNVPADLNTPADLAFPGAPDEERYFFTNPAVTTTTTTPTPPTTVFQGDSCWKCDQMNYSDCASKGRIETCTKGDKDCCFVEVRETRQKLQQLCTGCKDKKACLTLRDENFVTSNIGRFMHQCKPDYRQQFAGRFAGQQSVCRQCFSTCTQTDDTALNGGTCFGGSFTNTKMLFDYDLETNHDTYPWKNYYKQADSHLASAFGIPITAGQEGEPAQITVTAKSDSEPRGHNIYMSSNVLGTNTALNNGKTSFGTNGKTMYFWGLHGATKAWWQSDLKAIQTSARLINPGSVEITDLNP